MARPSRRATATAAAAALALTLAACSGDRTPDAAERRTPAGTPTSAEQFQGPNNETDVAFAQRIITHHRQAVQLSDLALDRAQGSEVLALADDISAAHGREIQALTAALEAWDADVPADDTPTAGADELAGLAEVMSLEQMTELQTASGPDFDQLFLRVMVDHHEGAVAMAESELDDGQNPTAQQLAQAIVDRQETEIDRMQELLAP